MFAASNQTNGSLDESCPIPSWMTSVSLVSQCTWQNWNMYKWSILLYLPFEFIVSGTFDREVSILLNGSPGFWNLIPPTTTFLSSLTSRDIPHSDLTFLQTYSGLFVFLHMESLDSRLNSNQQPASSSHSPRRAMALPLSYLLLRGTEDMDHPMELDDAQKGHHIPRDHCAEIYGSALHPLWAARSGQRHSTREKTLPRSLYCAFGVAAWKSHLSQCGKHPVMPLSRLHPAVTYSAGARGSYCLCITRGGRGGAKYNRFLTLADETLADVPHAMDVFINLTRSLLVRREKNTLAKCMCHTSAAAVTSCRKFISETTHWEKKIADTPAPSATFWEARKNSMFVHM